MKLVIIMEANQKFIKSSGGVIFINQVGIFLLLKEKKTYLTDSKREIQLRKKL